MHQTINIGVVGCGVVATSLLFTRAMQHARSLTPCGDTHKASWPKPIPGGFNYYQASAEHLIDCIRNDLDPIPNVEWGRHITEMLYGAIVSSHTGQRYMMTTTLE